MAIRKSIVGLGWGWQGRALKPSLALFILFTNVSPAPGAIPGTGGLLCCAGPVPGSIPCLPLLCSTECRGKRGDSCRLHVPVAPVVGFRQWEEPVAGWRISLSVSMSGSLSDSSCHSPMAAAPTGRPSGSVPSPWASGPLPPPSGLGVVAVSCWC